VAGNFPPEIENPVPVIEAELIVTATVPLEVTVTDFVTAVPSATLPNDSDVALRLNADAAAFSCIAKLWDEEFALTATVAFCAVLTAATFAVKDVVDAPAATVTLAGTVTALSLLVTDRLKPPDGAAEFIDTVHAVVPAPVKVPLPHENALIEDANGEAGPLRLMDVALEPFPSVAVKVTVCELGTPDTFATKLALALPAGTNTEIGTVTAALLLARATAKPPLGAAAVNVTLQVSVPAPVIDELAQLTPARETPAEVACPLPCSLAVLATVTFALVLTLTLSCPVMSVAVAGSKPTCTFMVEPAASVAGSAPAFAVNADVEVLNCKTCTGDVPEFVIDTV
jgi:hypothetical protein